MRCLAEVDELLDEVLLEKESDELEEDVEEMDEDDFLWQSDEEEDASEAGDHDLPRGCNSSTRTLSRNAAVVSKVDCLTEKLFALCITFLTQIFQGGEDESKTPLVHFCGVLRIDWKQSRFRDPGNYTPHLAGIMWVARLLFLKYALPSQVYSTLDWPSREYYNDHQWRLESM